MTLGQRIREARLERQLTQQELVGDYITRNMLSKIENDAATPSVRTLEYLATAMGMNPGVFLSDLSGETPVTVDKLRQLLERGDKRFLSELEQARGIWFETGEELALLEARYLLETEGNAEGSARITETRPGPGGTELRTEYLLTKANALIKLGRHSEAAVFLIEAEELAPGNKEVFSALEVCYSEQGDYQKAYFYAKKAAM